MNKPSEIITLTEIGQLPKTILENKEVMSTGLTSPWCTVSNQKP